MTVSLAQVDAFTSTPFGGNPAAVCLLNAAADPAWMASVAKETAMPATAFVVPPAGSPEHADGGAFGLRWFTVTAELELCGHGTLASAHVLYESGRVARTEAIAFQSRGGPLMARCSDGWIQLDFPAIVAEEIAAPPGLLSALGVDPARVGYVGRGRLDCIVEVANESIVRDLQPDLVRLRDVKARGVIVTSRSSSADRDFVSRFFAPSVGIGEDSVTGSAHCCLTPFWARRLGKTTFVAHQLSARGGVLKLALDAERVKIAGQAVTVLRGELLSLG